MVEESSLISLSAASLVGTSRATMILSGVLVIPGRICHVERSRDISIIPLNNKRFLDFARNDRTNCKETMQVIAPAKINLSLKIIGRRDDGFHELDTLIAPISLYDEIRLDKGRPGKGIEFRCDDPSVPQGDDNLVVRAAKAFFEITEIEPTVSIQLQKKIPHGAGLGGGSSDAASV